jgi:hypothetical protein
MRVAGGARDDAAPGHDRDRIGQALRLLDVVRGHEHGEALVAQVVDERPELLADLRIEPDGRLVQQRDAGLVDEAAGDEQAPAHPARQRVQRHVRAIGEAGAFQRQLHRGAPVLAAHAVQRREHREVLARRELDVEAVELRDHADLRPDLLRLPRELEAEDVQPARVGERLRGQQAHRRGLPRAVGSQEPHARPALNIQVEAVDRDPFTESLDHTPEADCGVHAG